MMERLPMCRICLAENVRMYIVVNRKLHELYEKLTDIPFVTEDYRPIIACVFCCAKLKQCYQLLRQCVEAEKLLSQMVDEDHKLNPLINQARLEFCSGLVTSPIFHISTDDECEAGNTAIKEELPAVSDGLDDGIEPMEEYQSDELEHENIDNRCLDVADIPPFCYESDLEDNIPLIKCKTEVEDEKASKKERRVTETIKLEPENLDDIGLDVADRPPHCYESNLEDDILLIKCKTAVEAEKVSKKKRKARETISISLLYYIEDTVVRKPKQDTRRTKEKDAITAEQTTKDKSDSNVIRTTHKWTSKPGGTCFKEPYICIRSSSNNVRKHTSEKPYKCQRNFKPYKCDICQRRFSQKGCLTRHMRIHTGEKPYQCDICQRSFSRKVSITLHMRTHTGEKPYQCDICQRNFGQKRCLTTHVRTHTDENPYQCDTCQRNFREKVCLTVHMRTHTGEKPYQCDICQRSFSQKGRLTVHMRAHTGEKPYQCDICQRNFSEKGTLTRHMRTHTGEKPYQCDICQRNFSIKWSLTMHMRTHIGEV